VVAQAVAHHQVHLGQRQRRRAALLVGPLQRAAADHELGLFEEPVGGGAVVAAGAAEVEAGDEQPATWITPDLEVRAVDQQLLETQLEANSERGESEATTRGSSSAGASGCLAAPRP
jgi:hypothetical protein